MATDVAGLLVASAEELRERVLERLVGATDGGRPTGDPSRRVERMIAALVAAAEAGRSGPLTAAGLDLARAEADPVEGYRRALRLLEVLCSESARLIKNRLEADEGRLVIGRLRALVGPAELGLAAVLRSPEPPGELVTLGADKSEGP